MRHLKTLVIAGLIGLGFGATSFGQLVEVRPGYVRAPFVRVYRSPDGGGYVRAPFVSRYTPGFRRGYERPPEVGSRQQLAYASGELSRQLTRFKTGDGWQNYLLVGPGKPLSSESFLQAELNTTALADALSRYDSARANPEFGMITGLPAFKAMHAGLNEYLGARQSAPLSGAEELPTPGPTVR